MKTCLFGGSFDPIHAGHLAIAAAAQEQADLQRVVFLPANRSPFKQAGSGLFSGEVRMQLLRAAVADLPWAEVSDLDLRLPAPSWSYRLVEAFRAQCPENELFWLLGTDQWEQLHRWAGYDYLVSNLTFIVYHRDTLPQPRPGVRSLFINGPDHPASSSIIRRCLLARTPVPSGWLPASVSALISCMGI